MFSEFRVGARSLSLLAATVACVVVTGFSGAGVAHAGETAEADGMAATIAEIAPQVEVVSPEVVSDGFIAETEIGVIEVPSELDGQIVFSALTEVDESDAGDVAPITEIMVALPQLDGGESG